MNLSVLSIHKEAVSLVFALIANNGNGKCTDDLSHSKDSLCSTFCHVLMNQINRGIDDRLINEFIGRKGSQNDACFFKQLDFRSFNDLLLWEITTVADYVIRVNVPIHFQLDVVFKLTGTRTCFACGKTISMTPGTPVSA